LSAPGGRCQRASSRKEAMANGLCPSARWHAEKRRLVVTIGPRRVDLLPGRDTKLSATCISLNQVPPMAFYRAFRQGL